MHLQTHEIIHHKFDVLKQDLHLFRIATLVSISDGLNWVEILSRDKDSSSIIYLIKYIFISSCLVLLLTTEILHKWIAFWLSEYTEIGLKSSLLSNNNYEFQPQ